MGKLGLGLTALALAGATAVTCATVNDRDKKNTELTNTNTQLEITIDNQKDELLSKETELSQTKELLSNAKKQITTLQENNTKLQSDLDKTVLEKTQLQADLTSRDNQLALLNQSISEKETEISNLNNTIATKNTELETLQTNYDNLQDTSSAEKIALQNQISEKQTEIENLNLQLTEKQVELNNIIEQKATLENEKQNLQNKLDSVYSMIEELYTTWNMTLPEGTELAETRDAQIEQKANAIAEYIDSQASQIAELQTQVDSLTTENSNLRQQIENLKSNMPQLATPTIALDGNRLKVTDSENGPFKGTYALYKNGEYLDSVTTDSNGIAQIYMYGDGYTLTAKATYIGCKESDFSNELSIPTGCFNVTLQFDAPVLTMDGTQAKWEHVTTNGTQCARYAYQIYSVDDSEIAKFSGTTFQNYLDLTSLTSLPNGKYFIKIQCDAATGFTASEFSNNVYFEKYSSGLKAMLYAAEISAEGLRIKIEKNEGNFFDEYGYLVYFTSADPNEHETNVKTSFTKVKAGDYLDLSSHIKNTEAFKVYVVTFDSNNTYSNSIPSNVVLLKGADYVEPTVQFDAPVLTMEGSQINWEHIFSGEAQCSNYICSIYNSSDNKVIWSGPNISVNYLDINGTGLASRPGSYYIQIQCRSQVGIAASVLSNKIYFTINGVGIITQVQN